MDSKQLALRRPIISRRSGSVGGELAAALERSSLATASFRVYYSSLRPGAVPFLWESTPGTPKGAVVVAASVTLGSTPKSAVATAAVVSPGDEMAAAGLDAAELPAISPPPSYHSSQRKKGRGRCRERSLCTAGRVLRALFTALGIRRRSRRRPALQL